MGRYPGICGLVLFALECEGLRDCDDLCEIRTGGKSTLTVCRLFGPWLEFFAVAEPHSSADTITYWKMRLSDWGLSSASRDVIPKRSFISPGRNARCSMGPGKMRYTYTTCSASSELFTLSKRKNPMGKNCAMKAKDPVSSFVTIWVLQPLAAHTEAKSLSNRSGSISQFSPTHRSDCEMTVCSRRIYSARNESDEVARKNQETLSGRAQVKAY